MLGRWSPSWRAHQAAYYTDIGSRRSSLRWATAVIHKLLLVSWDFWQYRNDRLHSSAGPRELAFHSNLNADIESEYLLGTATLPADARSLITSRTLEDLKNDSVVGKRQWIRSVRAGRIEFASQLGTRHPAPAVPTTQATRFLAWLGISVAPTQ